MLTEDTPVPVTALPFAAFRAHLRMGTGFGEETLQDEVLEMHLRAALAAIEARTGKILLTRGFRWAVTRWRDALRVALPVAPVVDVTAISLVGRLGTETPVAASRWQVVRETMPPQLMASYGSLPMIPHLGQARVNLTAGYGPTWDDVPGDLAQAVMLLAGHYYEFRHSAEGRGVDMPVDVAALIAPHSQTRIGFGGAL